MIARTTRSTPTLSQSRRRGFTLLELLLATIIGGMVLAGLYIALNMTVVQTQASRDAAETEGLSRAVFNKIGLDLSNVLGPAPPKSGGTPGETAAISTGDTTDGTAAEEVVTDPAAEAGTAPTDPAAPAAPAVETITPTPTTGSTTTDGSATTEMSTEETTGTQIFPLQVGVIGTSSQLTIFASRVPGVLGTPGALAEGMDASSQQASDLVRIDYWLGAGGLCRQERPWVTAEQTGNSFSFAVSDESGFIIADEVSELLFEYFDGSSWLETWEGGSGAVPAPPAAIRITLKFSWPNVRGGEPFTKSISQTIAVRVAPGSYAPVFTDPVVSTGAAPAEDTGTDMSGGTSGSTTPANSGSGSGASGGGGSTPAPSGGTGAGGSSGGSTPAPSGGGSTGGRTPTGGGGGASGGSTGGKTGGGR